MMFEYSLADTRTDVYILIDLSDISYTYFE
jgi:hypothetical protein